METSSTPVAETTVSVAEAVARPAATAQPGIPGLSQFTEQQIADAIVQLARIPGLSQFTKQQIADAIVQLARICGIK